MSNLIPMCSKLGRDISKPLVYLIRQQLINNLLNMFIYNVTDCKTAVILYKKCLEPVWNLF